MFPPIIRETYIVYRRVPGKRQTRSPDHSSETFVYLPFNMRTVALKEYNKQTTQATSDLKNLLREDLAPPSSVWSTPLGSCSALRLAATRWNFLTFILWYLLLGETLILATCYLCLGETLVATSSCHLLLLRTPAITMKISQFNQTN